MTRTKRACQRGSVMVEFALSTVILFALTTGIFGFGYAINSYDNLQNAVRDAARYASRKPYDSATSTPSSAFQTAVRNMVLYQSTTAGTSPVVKGLAASNVALTVTMQGGAPMEMNVAITNFQLDAVFFTISLNGSPSVTFPYLGIPTPN